MSKLEMKRFCEEIKDNETMQKALAEGGTDVEAVVAIARQNGFDFTTEELESAAEEVKSKLSDEELDKLSAGSIVWYSRQDLYEVVVDLVVGVAAVACG